MAQISHKSRKPKYGKHSCVKSTFELGPNSYNPVQPQRHLPNIDFKRKKEVEEFSKYLGYKVPDKLKEKEEEAIILGPCWHDVVNLDDLDLDRRNRCLEKKQRGFSCAPRFTEYPSKTPGPGTYIKRHSDFIIHQFTPLNSFNWNFAKRGYPEPSNWSIAPNRYMYERDFNSMFENIQRRKVSKRGPYDLFTGPRDETTIKNHYGPPLARDAKNWPYKLMSSIDALLQDKYKGMWSDCPREILLPTKDVHEVSPCQYDPILTSAYKPQNKRNYGFYSSRDPAIPEIKFKVHPGPGRYTFKRPKNVNGCTSAFLSKRDRFDYLVKKPDSLGAYI